MRGVQWLNTSETLASPSLRIFHNRGAMACAAKERTALEKHSQQMKHMEDAAVMLYPMYTVPLEALLLMTEVRPHQELLEDQAQP